MSDITYSAASGSTDEQLARVLNTAVISSRADDGGNPSEELCKIMETSEFRAILSAIRQLARENQIPEKEAAEGLVATFRRLDEIWGRYVFLEGVDKLKNRR